MKNIGPVRFSIRYKFLGVMTVLLMACVCVYLLIAVKVFKSDKTELVFDLNRSQVSNLASEFETQFSGVSEKFKLFAVFSEQGAKKAWLQELFSSDSDVVFVSLFKNKELTKNKFKSKSYKETYGLSDNYFEEKVLKTSEVPFEKIQKNNQAFWNATVANGPPLIGFGRSVVLENEQGHVVDQMAVVGFIKADRFMKALSLVNLSQIKIVNKDGEVLLPTRGEINSPLFKLALTGKTKTSVVNIDDQKGEKILGAYSKVFENQVFVLAEASEEKAFYAVSQLIQRSLIFSLIVMTAAFLAAILLSRSLTKPLSALVDRMSMAAEGDLSTQIHLGTQDEIGVLAESFNQMIFDLKESRDQLEEINRDLDQKVKERTRQLEEQNRAVKEAQEALLRTTRLASVGEIAGRAAHEVLNPLTSLLTRVGIMEKKIKGEMAPHIQVLHDIHSAWSRDYAEGGFDRLLDSWKQPSAIATDMTLWQEDLQNIQGFEKSMSSGLIGLQSDTEFLAKEGGRINKIINGMRKLSVTQSDRKPCSLHEILQECSLIMGDLFNQKNCKIVHDFQSESDLVEVDRDEVIQAMTNLMRNSLHAMEDAYHGAAGKGVLRISSAKVGSEIQVYFEDNGAGISSENQQKLFQGQFSTKNPDQGTGLGLGISRRFIRSSGGDVEFVSSIPNSKTVFLIRIPLFQVNSKGVAA